MTDYQQLLIAAGITPGTIHELYLKHTDVELAAQASVFDQIVPEHVVAYWRKKWGVKTLTFRQRRDLGKGIPDISGLTKEKFLELHTNFGDTQIAKIYNISKQGIAKLRQRYGIAAVSYEKRINPTDELTDFQKAVIIGTSLGDGHITASGCLKLDHSAAQMNYIKFKHGVVANISKRLQYFEGDRFREYLTYGFTFVTSPHSWVKELRSILYPDGIKVFPLDVIASLKPVSLAMWYFDDGHYEDYPSIAMGLATLTDVDNAIVGLDTAFGLKTYLSPRSLPNCHVLQFRAESSDRLFELVAEFATPDVAHKIPKKFWPIKIDLPKYKVTREELQVSNDLQKKSKSWLTMTEAEQAEHTNNVFLGWREVGFPFQTPKSEELQTIVGLEDYQILDEDTIKACQVGQSICQAFMPHIWGQKPIDSTYSIKEIFDDDHMFKTVIVKSLNEKKSVTAGAIRSSLRSYRRSGLYNFRPAAARVLVDKYCVSGGTVFDPCAGWGGRLLGVLLSEQRVNYVACEPSSATFNGLNELTNWLQEHGVNANNRVHLHNTPIEDFIVPDGIDLILTSPPYWKKEIYSDEPTQSSIRYTTYSDWLDRFLKPLIENSWKKLNAGGHMILNVDDFNLNKETYNLVEDTQRIATQVGCGSPISIFKYDMASYGVENFESVLIWQKESGVVLPFHTRPKVKCQHCGGDFEARAGKQFCSTLCRVKGHRHNSKLQSDTAKFWALDEYTRSITDKCRSCGFYKLKSNLLGHVCSDCSVLPHNPKKICKFCSNPFQAENLTHQYCTEACYKKYRRREYRKTVPAKTTRTAKCQICENEWEVPATGGWPTKCDQCKNQSDLDDRKRVCQYRHCNTEFVDTSKFQGMHFCSPEHRGAEKRIRSGATADVPPKDLVIGRQRSKCMLCKQPFLLNGTKNTRCDDCKVKTRTKQCLRCSNPFIDDSANNTCKFCIVCTKISR